MRAVCLVLWALLAWLAAPLAAHEVRPAYLELRETTAGEFEVLWKVPLRGGKRLELEARLPAHCQALGPPASVAGAGAEIRRWRVSCGRGLAGGTIAVDGLENTLTDVLVRLETARGVTQTVRLQPATPSFVVASSQSWIEVARTYLRLGIEHILLGVDHLLFVFALLLIVTGRRRLVAAITAFTVAHSLTLAGATLGYLHMPQQPVEAVIALSILFLAAEIVHRRQGRRGIAERRPWSVAFIFGLLHGFGFAGALAEVGLPDTAIPLALLFFNIGVELGQLAFVAGVLAMGLAMRGVRFVPVPAAEMAATYAIGAVAAFWTIERVVGFWV